MGTVVIVAVPKFVVVAPGCIAAVVQGLVVSMIVELTGVVPKMAVLNGNGANLRETYSLRLQL